MNGSWREGERDGRINVWKPHLFRFGAFTPAIFGVSHLMYRKLAPTSPNTATIEHILVEPTRFNFRRLLIYAPVTRRYSSVSYMSPGLQKTVLSGARTKYGIILTSDIRVL